VYYPYRRRAVLERDELVVTQVESGNPFGKGISSQSGETPVAKIESRHSWVIVPSGLPLWLNVQFTIHCKEDAPSLQPSLLSRGDTDESSILVGVGQ
jgi:hypothetical protein